MNAAINQTASRLQVGSACLMFFIDETGGMVAQINGKMIPTHKGLIAKSQGLLEPEVADFIMNAAGGKAFQVH